jgi:hypothetical protein
MSNGKFNMKNATKRKKIFFKVYLIFILYILGIDSNLKIPSIEIKVYKKAKISMEKKYAFEFSLKKHISVQRNSHIHLI